MSAPSAAAAACERMLLTPTSWVLQVKGKPADALVSCCEHSQQRSCALVGIPETSTNEEMRKHFSEAIAYFGGPSFTYAFLHTDPARVALDSQHLPQHALLQYSSLDGKLVPDGYRS